MSTIFISHSSKDNAIARDLERFLAKMNHPSVFLDLDPEKGILAGQSWERTLYRKLRACRAVIAVCTDNYLSSYWCFAEIALARMMGKLIFALKVDGLSDDANMPSILMEKQFIDLRTNESEGYRRLRAGLKEEDVLGIGSAYNPKKDGPYLGLSTFEEKHAAIFFGRDAETRAGLEALSRGAPGLVMTLGSSGSGKSSLVRAGMVPRLRRDADQWIVVDPIRPGIDPFMELAAALEGAYSRFAATGLKTPNRREILRRLKAGASALDERPSAADTLSVGPGASPRAPVAGEAAGPGKTDERLPLLMQYLESLRQSPPRQADDTLLDFLDWSVEDLRAIVERVAAGRTASEAEQDHRTPLQGIARHLRRVSGHTEARVLLIVDQFEELLGHQDQASANRFLRLLRASLEAEHSPLMVLGTMRSDFLGVFQRNAALRGIEYASLSLGPMQVDAMRQVIEKPAEIADITLEDGLADRLLEDTETPDALPLLSFTLWKLHDDYTDDQDRLLEVAEYADLGGIHGAIAKEADAIADVARNQGAEDDLRAAFLRMARLNEDGSSYARQPAPLNDPKIARVEGLLRLFEKRRLVVFRTKGDTEFVEVAHEALFRSWEPLKAWLDNNRAEMLLRQQLRRDAAAWEKAGRNPDNLWRGGRLLQARELMQRTSLSPDEEAFVRSGVRRRRIRIGAAIGTTAATMALIIGFAVNSQIARTHAEDSTRVAMAAEWLSRGQATNAALTLLELSRPENFPFAAARMSDAIERGIARFALHGHAYPGVYRAAFDPADGSRVVTAGRDRQAIIWDAESGARLYTSPPHPAMLTAAALGPGGDRLVTAGATTVWVGSPAAGTRERLGGHADTINNVVFSANGAWLLTASDDTTARLWNLDDSERRITLPNHTEPVQSAAFSPAGDRVVTASFDGTARVWDAGDGSELRVLKHGDHVYDAAYSRDGRYIVTGGHGGKAYVWNADTGQQLRILRGHEGVIHGVATSETGLVATAGFDNTLRLWDIATGDLLRVLTDHTDRVLFVAFSPDGSRLVSTSDDGSTRVWDTGLRNDNASRGFRYGPMTLRADDDAAAIGSVAFAPAGDRLVTTNRDLAFVWDAASGRSVRRIGPFGSVIAASFLRDGPRLLTGNEDGSLLLSHAAGDSGSIPLQGGRAGEVNEAIFSPDGRLVATFSFDETLSRTVSVWDARSGARRHTLAHDETVYKVAFDPGGKLLVSATGTDCASAAATTALHRWNLETGETMDEPADDSRDSRFAGHTDCVQSLAFSHDGRRLASGSQDFTAIVWNVETGQLLHRLSGHPEWVSSVAFSPDDSRLATASGYGPIYIWDAERGNYLWQRDVEGEVVSLTFSPDGQRLAAVTHPLVNDRLVDASAKIWDVGVDLLWPMAKTATRACLSPEAHRQIGVLSPAQAERQFDACEEKQGRSGENELY